MAVIPPTTEDGGLPYLNFVNHTETNIEKILKPHKNVRFVFFYIWLVKVYLHCLHL